MPKANIPFGMMARLKQTFFLHDGMPKANIHFGMMTFPRKTFISA
jgi:hypothetical protein